MTEHLSGNIEHKHPSLEVERPHEDAEASKPLEKQPEKDSRESIESIQKSIDQYAHSTKEITVEEQETKPSGTYLSREVKQSAYKQTMKQMRRHLSSPERTFSRIIHQPIVDVVSENSAKTIARPSGILGGGITALLGGSALLYLAKHYGFQYNYLVFILLFVAGFALGLLLEIVFKTVRHFKR